MLDLDERLIFRYTKYDILAVVFVIVVLIGSFDILTYINNNNEANIKIQKLQTIQSCYNSGNTDCYKIDGVK